MTDRIIRIRVDARDATRGINQVENQMGRLQGTTNQLQTQLTRLAQAIAAAFSVSTIVAYADAYTNIQNRLRVVTDSTEQLTRVTAELLQVANATRAEFESTAILFSTLTRSTEELGISEERLIAITKTINQTFAVSGASAEEASNAIRQLSQGLASGALRGDEFNSVAEQAPGILRAVAAETGKTVGELREFAATGGITADLLIRALENYGATVEREFGQTNRTFAQSAVVARNNAVAFVGASKQVNEAVTAAGNALVRLSNNLDTAAQALALIGAVIAGRYLSAVVLANAANLQFAAAVVSGNASLTQGVAADRARAASLVQSTAATAAKTLATQAAAAAEVASWRAVLQSIKTELELEAVRLRAQISDIGRQQSLQRLAAIRLELAAATTAQTAAEATLAGATAAATTAANAATAATARLGQAQAAATLTARGLALAATGLRSVLTFLGGPLGVILLAATAFLIFSSNSEVARVETEKLISVNDLLAQSYEGLTIAQANNTRFQINQQITALKAQQEELRKTQALTKGLTQDELAAAAAFTGAAASTDELGNASAATQSKIDTLDQQIEQLNGRLNELPTAAEKAKGSIEALGSLGDSLSGLRSVSSGIDGLFSGEFNLFGGSEDTSGQDDQTAARINERIEALRLETQTIASEYAIQSAVRQQAFTQEEADLATQTANRIMTTISQRELLLAEDTITKEQQVAAETAFQEQLTAIDQLYNEQRLELQRQVNLEKQAIEQQTQDTYLDTASTALGALAGLVGGSSKAAKALKLVQAGVNAFQVFAASQAAAALVLATPPGPVLNPSLGPLAASIVAKGKVSAAAILAGAAAQTFSGGSSSGGIGSVSGGSSSQTLPATPQAAQQVGAVEITGLDDLVDELRAQDGVVSTQFVARLLDKVQDANRLRGEG